MTVIVDYGIGNLRSVQKAAEFLDKRVPITASAAVIERAEKIILPGVAHFGRAVKELKRRGLFGLLKEKIREGVPFLGVCVGMQVLLEESEEAPGTAGFGVIKGRVKKFNTRGLIVPHMGWNRVSYQLSAVSCQLSANRGQKTEDRGQKNSLFRGIEEGGYFYFANSYYCAPKDKSVIASTTDYGVRFASAIHKDNVWGVQFHPEKSQELGLKLLNNFLKG